MHPGLNRWALQLEADTLSWLRPHRFFEETGVLSCLVRIRYRQPLQKAQLIKKQEQFYILFENKQKGITPGQFAAWYLDNELLGSGVIA
jgi:tRNA-specific 2-thiouridylase